MRRAVLFVFAVCALVPAVPEVVKFTVIGPVLGGGESRTMKFPATTGCSMAGETPGVTCAIGSPPVPVPQIAATHSGWSIKGFRLC